MLPSNPWLTENENQFQPALDVPLPVGLSFVYYEGDHGQIDIPSPQTFREFNNLFVSSFIDRRIGYSGELERVLVLTFNQINVFGVLLLDSFRPPEISQELFDFPGETSDACTLDHPVGVDVPISGCQIGTGAVYTEQEGTSTSWLP